MDWDAHLRMMQEVRKLRCDAAIQNADRAGRLRTAFTSKDWEQFDSIKTEMATDGTAEKRTASGGLADAGSEGTGSDPVDPPMSGDE